jgi:ferredoxin
MPASRSDVAQARAQVYFALADALSEPHADLLDFLLEAATAGAEVAGSAACRTALPRLRELRALARADLIAAFRWATCGSGGRPLALYESLHRQGRLAGDATAAVAAYYRTLDVIPASGELPDHASVELAFLGELAAAEAQAGDDHALAARARAVQRRFLRTHAAMWLPAVGDRLSASGVPLYAAAGALLRDYLAEELAPRRSPARQVAVRPVLRDLDACTLCGLCTGACPHGALWIAEDSRATSLMLDPARCTGCRRCVQTCPERILSMAQAADYAGLPGALATSGRATCPQCGQPTVSQAELQAVFRRLQSDGPLGAAMQRRFCLCVACKSMS